MAILAVVMLKEAYNIWAWAGTLICFTGIGLIANAQPGGIALGGGAVFVLAAAICSAIGFVLQRKLVQKYGALHVASIMLISAAVTLSPWLLTAISEMQNASTATVSWVVFLGVFPTAVGQTCWSYALGYFGAARAGNFLYLVAPLATLLAWLMYGEVVSLLTITGGILVLSGVILVNTRGRGTAK
jgi:drug/metabolite transporter (DMT)-like permease